MKKDIHPKYNDQVKVSCACGNTFDIGSTAEQIDTEICSACHPFYTGKQKLVDTARRVEKFEAKVKAKESLGVKKGKTAKRAAKNSAKKTADRKAEKKTLKKSDK